MALAWSRPADMAATYSAPTSRAAAVRIIRAPTITTASTAAEFTVATTGEAVPITATITPTGTILDFTDGPITPGRRRCTGDGDGEARPGTDTTAGISRPIRCIRRRHSG